MKLKVNKDTEKIFVATHDSDEVAVSGPYEWGESPRAVVLSVGTKGESMHMIALDEDDVFTLVRALLNHTGYEPTFALPEEPDVAQAG